MAGKNKIFLYGILAMFLIPLMYNALNKEYGNDKESILKVIRSIEGYNSQAIEILEIKDINNERIVPFLIHSDPGYIQFTKNTRGNYEWQHIEKAGNQDLASFLVHLRGDEMPDLMFLFVTNRDNEIAKVELDVNGKVFNKEFKVNEDSAAWIDLPILKSAEYKYRYYSKDGNLVKE
ncbi:hypothetical protein ACQCVO_12375 [Bacillus infantis]|uniref:hypothetical protein n=1 Tax=Bacillus infantis TaxID=324767 RepID=UPI003CE84627